MNKVQPQPGDKFVVTGTVTADGAYPGKMTFRDGVPDTDWKLEILERTDDPSRDEIGTVAEIDGVDVPFVKTASNTWEPVGPGLIRHNADMAGRRVTGAVPGTPAAEYDGPDASFEDHPKWAAVREVLRGEPEPTAWPCKCGTDETDMVHTTETLLQRPQPVTAPVSAIVDRATGEHHEYPKRSGDECACPGSGTSAHAQGCPLHPESEGGER